MPNYHVALSFAGEDRAYVEEVAQKLKAEGVDVFYDKFEEANLWGKNLYTYLSNVYKNEAQFTVMFVSEAYRRKLWTNHERKSAQARAFEESEEYILPVLFDDSIEIPGLLKTIGYISDKTPQELTDLIIKKLKEYGIRLEQQFSYSEEAKADVDFPLLINNNVNNIIRALRSRTWPTQNTAVVKLLKLDWSTTNADEAFVLGRNLYQCACGGERKAVAILKDLRRSFASDFANLPEDRCLDLVNGMFFEVYFDAYGKFRGSDDLKKNFLNELLALQNVRKYFPSIKFIMELLSPYRLIEKFLPNIELDKASVNIAI